MERSHIMALEVLASAALNQAAFSSVVLLLDPLLRSGMSWCVAPTLKTEDLGFSLNEFPSFSEPWFPHM